MNEQNENTPETTTKTDAEARIEKAKARTQKGIERAGKGLRNVATRYFQGFIESLISERVRIEGTHLQVRPEDADGKPRATAKYHEKGNGWTVTASGSTVPKMREAAILAGAKALHFIRDGKEGGKVPEALMEQAKKKFQPPVEFDAACEILIEQAREAQPPTQLQFLLTTPYGPINLRIPAQGETAEGSRASLDALASQPGFGLVQILKGGKTQAQVDAEARLAEIKKASDPLSIFKKASVSEQAKAN
jgi:hypothetical protein